MKLLAFVDIHGSVTALNKLEFSVKKQNPDLLVCCGDVSIFEHYLDIIMKKIASFGKPVFIIHGNHESESVMKKLCSRYENLFFLHKKIKEFGDYLFVGYGGGGFTQVDKEFEQFAKSIQEKIKGKKLVLLTHGPPCKTRIDNYYGDNVGCKSFRKFITDHKPLLAVSGHIHETAGKQDFVGKTLVINPGPFGMVVEI